MKEFQFSESLRMIVADLASDDEVKYTILPTELFGSRLKEADLGPRLMQFNKAMANSGIVALPSLVETITGAFLVKVNVHLSENDLEAIRIFAEPVFDGSPTAVADYSAERVATLIAPKV